MAFPEMGVHMSNKRSADTNWVSWAVFGALMFAIGRFSVAAPDPQQPTAMMTAVDGATSSNIDASDAAGMAPSPVATDSDSSTEPASPSSDALGLVTDSPGRQCGTKRYCREMSSCDEAMFYLNECGVGRLDGDGDGVPCESIC